METQGYAIISCFERAIQIDRHYRANSHSIFVNGGGVVWGWTIWKVWEALLSTGVKVRGSTHQKIVTRSSRKARHLGVVFGEKLPENDAGWKATWSRASRKSSPI